jgi:8-hydroxy-5-deazaflavin:NADPH oxidoreductase
MKILVIGAGNMGSAFVKQLHSAGHAVAVTSKTPEKARDLAAQYTGVRSVLPAGAAEGQEVVILATPYSQSVEALKHAGDLSGKVVIDISNPLTDDYMGLTIGHSSSAAEEIARAVPQAVIVKGFNTLFAQVLAAGANFGKGQVASVFLAGDDAPAKKTVTALAQSLGFKAVDAGGLKNARYLEPLAGLNVYLGYGAGMGTAIAPAWVERTV